MLEDWDRRQVLVAVSHGMAHLEPPVDPVVDVDGKRSQGTLEELTPERVVLSGDQRTTIATDRIVRLDPAPGTLLSLADCEEHERHIVKAREHYQLAASGFPKNDPRRNFANGRAVALEKRIAHVTYHLVAEGAIRVNDVVLSRSDLDVATATDPGEVRVEVTAAGHHPKTMTVTLAEGETRTIECELGPPIEEAKPAAPPLPTPTAAPPHKSSDLRRPLAFAALGVGGVSLVVGGVTGLLAANNASTVKDHCDPNYVCDQEGVDAASAGQLFAPLSTITLVAGVVLVGTGAFLYFTSGKSAPKKVGLSEHLKAGGFVW